MLTASWKPPYSLHSSTDSTDGAKTATLANIGNQPLTAVAPGLAIGSPDFTQGQLAADCTASFSLAPGASCNLDISFAPQSGGATAIRLTLTDNSLNAPASQSIALSGTALVPVTVSAGPANSGISFTVDGTAYSSPRTFSWATGSTHTVSVSSVVTSSGTQYTFTGWSDGATATTDSISVTGSTASTLAAAFNAAYQLTTSAGDGLGQLHGRRPRLRHGHQRAVRQHHAGLSRRNQHHRLHRPGA